LLNETIIWSLLFALAGLLSGSVMGMAVYRLPLMIQNASDTRMTFNLWWPGSRCCDCHHPLAVLDNIPLFSWLALRGRCRYCNSKISWHYPLLELVCMLSAFGCALAWEHFRIAGSVFIYFWFALAMSAIDFRTLLLPDKLTLPLLWLGLLLNALYGTTALTDAVYGAAAGYGVLWLIYWLVWLLTRKEGLGYGDFKLLAAAGAWCGWQALPTILLVASLCGVIFALAQKVLRPDRGPMIAFGPWLAFSGWFYYCWLVW